MSDGAAFVPGPKSCAGGIHPGITGSEGRKWSPESISSTNPRVHNLHRIPCFQVLHRKRPKRFAQKQERGLVMVQSNTVSAVQRRRHVPLAAAPCPACSEIALSKVISLAWLPPTRTARSGSARTRAVHLFNKRGHLVGATNRTMVFSFRIDVTMASRSFVVSALSHTWTRKMPPAIGPSIIDALWASRKCWICAAVTSGTKEPSGRMSHPARSLSSKPRPSDTSRHLLPAQNT